MNERIKELWNNAAESTAAFPSGQNNSWETQVNFMDKFAELIVRECAGLCLTHEMADEPFGEKSYRKGRHFSALLKGHFGVEE